MPKFQKGHKKLGGRKPGTKNEKIQVLYNLREAFIQAFEGMGGVAELQAWGAKAKNRAQFYTMISKMLPKEMIVSNQTSSPDALPFRVVIEESKT